MEDEGLFIMPLGFKLPFRPEDFLSNKVAKYAASEKSKAFIQDFGNIPMPIYSLGAMKMLRISNKGQYLII